MAGKVPERIATYMEEFPPEEGLSLYYCEFVKEGSDRTLRVYIDVTEEGRYVSTEDCERVSRFLEERLDRDDPIDGEYVLEVSSPGMDRMLVTEEHFVRYTGALVDVHLYRPYEGEKTWQGTLLGRDENGLRLQPEGREEAIDLPLAQIAKVQLAVVI